ILLAIAVTVIGGSTGLIQDTFGIIGEETRAQEQEFDAARDGPGAQDDEELTSDSTGSTSDTTTGSEGEETSDTGETGEEPSQTVQNTVQTSFREGEGVTVRLNPSDTAGTRRVDVALRVSNNGQNRIVDRKTVTCRESCSTSFGFTPENGDEVTIEAQSTGPGGSTLLGRDTEQFGAAEQNPLCSVTLWSKKNTRGDSLTTAGGSTLHIGDSASSIRIKGGSTCEATLFQHTQYGGNSVTVDSDIDALGGFGENAPWMWCGGNWGNCISSIRVSGGDACRAILYDSTGYEGDAVTVTGDSSSLHLGDDVSSIDSVSCDIAIYEEEQFDGAYMRTDFRIRSFDDAINDGAPSFSDDAVSSLTTFGGIQVSTGGRQYTSETGSDGDDRDWNPSGSGSSSITVRKGDTLSYTIPGHFEQSAVSLVSPVKRSGTTGSVTIGETGQIRIAYRWNDSDSKEILRDRALGGDDRTGAYTPHHEIDSLPRRQNPGGTLRILTVPIDYGPGGSFPGHVNAIETILQEESVFRTCQTPSEAVQMVPLADKCHNEEEIIEACETGITDGLRDQGTCNRECADSVISCAAHYARQHNLEWDKSHGLFKPSWTSANREGGCAAKSNLFNDDRGSPKGGAVTLVDALRNGTTGAHEIGHDYGLCHGRSASSWSGPLSVRPCKPSEDPSCNPFCDPEQNEDCTQDVADTYGTCKGCQSSYCPNDDPAAQEDIMNYQNGKVFMPQE
ncbi:MAG: hypothetical protein ABEI97_00725, partial [Candidatus Nanohaloarchaea archaeon]